jgi:hypothetical protein
MKWIGSSFTIDSYEYVHTSPTPRHDGRERDPFVLHGGGSGMITSSGFEFDEGDCHMLGPLTAILAVRTAR